MAIKEVSQQDYEDVLNSFQKCEGTRLQLGDRVEKIDAEPNDEHPNGSRGIVTGGVVIMKEDDTELYMIAFDQDKDKVHLGGQLLTVTIGSKLKLI